MVNTDLEAKIAELEATVARLQAVIDDYDTDDSEWQIVLSFLEASGVQTVGHETAPEHIIRAIAGIVEMRQLLEETAADLQCRCCEAYTGRGMHAPETHCELGLKIRKFLHG